MMGLQVKHNQQQASIAFGGGVMPRQHCVRWVLLEQPYRAIPKKRCPDLNLGSPVYKTGTLFTKPQHQVVLRVVGWLATESVESSGE